MEYNTTKTQRRLPSVEKKCSVKLLKPRLIPYSKVECSIILNFKEKEVGWLAKQIYVSSEEHKITQSYNIFAEELKNKTTFKNPRFNFYSKYVDDDKNTRLMLFFDVLLDFCQKNKISCKFIPQYYEIMKPFFNAH